jgi:hypothetical protein
MTRTTAKKGMLEYKAGHSKDQFDFDYLANLPYNEKILVKHLIDKLNDADYDNNKLIVALKEQVDTQDSLIKSLSLELENAKKSIKEIEQKYIEIIKGLITR